MLAGATADASTYSRFPPIGPPSSLRTVATVLVRLVPPRKPVSLDLLPRSLRWEIHCSSARPPLVRPRRATGHSRSEHARARAIRRDCFDDAPYISRDVAADKTGLVRMPAIVWPEWSRALRERRLAPLGITLRSSRPASVAQFLPPGVCPNAGHRSTNLCRQRRRRLIYAAASASRAGSPADVGDDQFLGEPRGEPPTSSALRSVSRGEC